MVRRIDVFRIEAGTQRGTGFLIAPDRLMTALHVVGSVVDGAFRPHGDIVAHAAVAHGGALVGHSFAIDADDQLYVDEACDCACFRIAAIPGVEPFAVAAVARGDHRERWWTYGFPGGAPRDGKGASGHVTSTGAAIEISGGVRTVLQLYSLEAGAGRGGLVHGYSGAPVVIGDRVVALLTHADVQADRRAEDGTLYAVPLAPLAGPLRLDVEGALLPLPADIGYPASPYRNLHRYTRADARVLFGRDRDIQEVLAAILRPARPLLLLTGQAGAGKSSLLEAGVLPRLEGSHAARLARIERGDVRAAWRAATGGNWCAAEQAAGKPLVVVLDQLEEAMPSLDAWLREDLAACMHEGRWAPRGMLVLSFRKEWAADIQQLLAIHGAPDWHSIYLGAIDRAGIVEAVHGIARLPRYQATVEPGLGEHIADRLLSDPAAPLAPTLQIWLTEMYERSRALTRASLDAYLRGGRLGDFLERQLAALPDAAQAGGLALDLLDFHVGPLISSVARTHEERAAAYAHVPAAEDATFALAHAGLVVPLEDRSGYRLIHDALAPVVRERMAHSDADAQRARRILDGHQREWLRGAPLDDARGRLAPLLGAHPLAVVEAGRAAMRALDAEEGALVRASRLREDIAAISLDDSARLAALAQALRLDARSPALDRRALALIATPAVRPFGRAGAGALSGDGRVFAVHADGELWVTDAARFAVEQRLRGEAGAPRVHISHTGAWVVLAGDAAMTAIERATGARHGYACGAGERDHVFVGEHGELFVVAPLEVLCFMPGAALPRWRSPLSAQHPRLTGAPAHLVWAADKQLHALAVDGRLRSWPLESEVFAASPRQGVVALWRGNTITALHVATGATATLCQVAEDAPERPVIQDNSGIINLDELDRRSRPPRALILACSDEVYVAAQRDRNIDLYRGARYLGAFRLQAGEVLLQICGEGDRVALSTPQRLLYWNGKKLAELVLGVSLEREPHELALHGTVLTVWNPASRRLRIADFSTSPATVRFAAVAPDMLPGAPVVSSRGLACVTHGKQAFLIDPSHAPKTEVSARLWHHVVLAVDHQGVITFDEDTTLRRQRAGGEPEVLARIDAPTVTAIATAGARCYALTADARVLCLENGDVRAQLESPGGHADRLAVSPDHRWLLAQPRDRDGACCVWRLGAPRAHRLAHPGVRAHAFSRSGRWLATASRASVVVWSLATLAPIATLPTGPRLPPVLGFSDEDRLVLLWPGDDPAPREADRFQVTEVLGVEHGVLSPAARWLAIGGDRVPLEIASTAEPTRRTVLPWTGRPYAIDDHARWLVFHDGVRHQLASIEPAPLLALGGLDALSLAPDGNALVTVQRTNHVTWYRLDAMAALREQTLRGM